MQKSIEERLADIESGITRLTKMQGCMLNALLLMEETSMLIRRTELSVTSAKESLKSINQGMDRFIVLFFGAITMLGIATSMLSLYLVTLDFTARVLSIVFPILALVCFFLGFLEYRRASSQIRVTRKTFAQRGEDSASTREEAKAIDDALAQILAEWKELVPDDLVSESRNGTSGPKDSHDRS